MIGRQCDRSSFHVGTNGNPIALEADGWLYELLLNSDGTYTGGRKRLG